MIREIFCAFLNLNYKCMIFHLSELLISLKDPWLLLQSGGSPKICAFYAYIQGCMTEDDRQENKMYD